MLDDTFVVRSYDKVELDIPLEVTALATSVNTIQGSRAM